MSSVIQVDTFNWRSSIRQLQRTLRLDAAQIIREESKQFVRTARNFTFPRKQKDGEGAIEWDMLQLATPLRPEKIENKRLKEAVITGDHRRVEMTLAQFPTSQAGRGKARAIFSPRKVIRAGELPGLYRRVKNKRGRVVYDQGNAIINVRQYDQYIANKKKNVGILKAGFNPAARAFGIPTPQWIARHGDRYGSMIDFTDGENPQITITNAGVRYPDYRATIRAALRSRSKTMQKKLRLALSGNAAQAGFKQ